MKHSLQFARCLITWPGVFLAAMLAMAPPGVFAAGFDWPQWRGPNRDEVSKETGLLKTWPEGGPQLLWTFDEAGIGYSTPAVVGDILYAQGSENEKETIYALDTKSKKKAWSTEVGPLFVNQYGDGPRGTPTVAGDLTFAIGGQGNLACLKTGTGEKLWSKSLQKDFGGEMMSSWGYTESPLVDGDQVVVTPGGAKGAVVALNKKNGDLIWQTSEFTDKAAYCSIVVSEACGIRQYVQMTGDNVVGIDPKDGHILWKFARKGPVACIPTPIVSGNYVFVTSGYNAGCNLLELTKAGDKFEVKEVYHKDADNKRIVNHHGGVLLVDGFLYGHSDSKGWTCQNMKSGDVAWNEPARTLAKGSLTYADGRLYCYSENDGTCVLAEATPTGWKEDGRFKIPQQTKHQRKSGHIWAHPVVANGKLYLRDQEFIFCYDVKETK
jgi:outer membrane protein assembly factor BamB